MPTNVPLEMPPGIVSDNTASASDPAYVDCSNVRFRLGRAQTIGGWERASTGEVTGACRTAFPWTDNSGVLNVALGTHSKLQLLQGSAIYDITPYGPPAQLAANPFAVTDGSTTATVTQTAHGLSSGNDVIISGAVSVGRVMPSGTYEITVTDDDHYTIVLSTAADTAKTLGSNPLSVTNGSAVVTVTEAAHGIATGTSVTVSGASAVGGITPNGTFPITVLSANTYSYTFTSAATSTATGGGAAVVATVPATGGGSAVEVLPQVPLPAGAVNGTGTAGYSTGTYGTGLYSAVSAEEFYPRTWSFGAWGENLLASPKGGTIYQWATDTSARAAVLPNAPLQIAHMLVAPNSGGYQVFALGCNEESSGEFNPLCIRHSSVRNNEEWSTTNSSTAREYILTGGGRIVAGRMCGKYLLVWTSQALFLGTFVGSLDQPWRFDQVGTKCGLIGPNAVVVSGQRAFWISGDLQFHSYALGGAVMPLACPIREDFAANVSASQVEKIVASTNATFDEVRWDYPDRRDGYENSRYLAVCVDGPDAGSWYRGIMARTAFVDAGPSSYPCGVTYDATSDTGTVYWHDRGNSADGAPLPWFIDTAEMYMDPDRTALLRRCWPDIGPDQQGAVSMTIKTRFTPQGDVTEHGPYPISVSDDKVDLLVTGRLFQIRFAGSTAPTFARMGKTMFELTLKGFR